MVDTDYTRLKFSLLLVFSQFHIQDRPINSNIFYSTKELFHDGVEEHVRAKIKVCERAKPMSLGPCIFIGALCRVPTHLVHIMLLLFMRYHSKISYQIQVKLICQLSYVTWIYFSDLSWNIWIICFIICQKCTLASNHNSFFRA